MSLDRLFGNLIEEGYLKEKPHSGKCMFCGKILDEFDLDHSVCNKCWDETFAHKFTTDKNGSDTCIHCDELEGHELHQKWEKAHRDVEPGWIDESIENG